MNLRRGTTCSVTWWIWLLHIVVSGAYLSGMKTNTAAPSAPRTSVTPVARERRGQARSGLPPGFDVGAWTREACERSGVPVEVSDPVVLAKLRVLTRPEN